jgi:hypothetical protein
VIGVRTNSGMQGNVVDEAVHRSPNRTGPAINFAIAALLGTRLSVTRA